MHSIWWHFVAFGIVLSLWTMRAGAQSSKIFATGEAQRIYNLLDGIGCFSNDQCVLKDFTVSSKCDHNTAALSCNTAGLLTNL
jgi:hypothetical protein